MAGEEVEEEGGCISDVSASVVWPDNAQESIYSSVDCYSLAPEVFVIVCVCAWCVCVCVCAVHISAKHYWGFNFHGK